MLLKLKHIMVKNIFITLTLFVLSCKSQTVTTPEKNPIKDTQTFESKVYTIQDEDKEMLIAIEMARKTFDEFEKAVKSQNSKYQNFTLKKAYKSREGDEYLWIKSVMFYAQKNTYVGIIGNVPMHTKEVQFDAIVEVDKHEISDWMYFENNVVRGGYTLRLLRSRMTDEEQRAFDKESGYIFE